MISKIFENIEDQAFLKVQERIDVNSVENLQDVFHQEFVKALLEHLASSSNEEVLAAAQYLEEQREYYLVKAREWGEAINAVCLEFPWNFQPSKPQESLRSEILWASLIVVIAVLTAVLFT